MFYKIHRFLPIAKDFVILLSSCHLCYFRFGRIMNQALIIGDSHVRQLRKSFQFNNTEVFGVGGMTTGQLRNNHVHRMRQYDRTVILVGGNDVCPTPVTGRPAIRLRTVLANLQGLFEPYPDTSYTGLASVYSYAFFSSCLWVTGRRPRGLYSYKPSSTELSGKHSRLQPAAWKPVRCKPSQFESSKSEARYTCFVNQLNTAVFIVSRSLTLAICRLSHSL